MLPLYGWLRHVRHMCLKAALAGFESESHTTIHQTQASAQEDLDAFLRMLRVMLATGQPGDADTIAVSLIKVGGKRFADRHGPRSSL